MAQPRAPRLTPEDCEQFLQDIRAGNPRADVLLRAHLDYCRRIALDLIKAGKVSHQAPGQAEQRVTYLPHAILVKLRYVTGIDETTAQVSHNAESGTGPQHAETANEWVEEIADDAMLTFVRHVRMDRYHCQGHQVTSYLYPVIVNILLKAVEKIDRQLKRGEVYDIPLEVFASGHDLSGPIYCIDSSKKPVSTGHQQLVDAQSQRQNRTPPPAATTANEDHAVSGEDESEPQTRVLDRLHPEQNTVLELIAAEETAVAFRHCIEDLPHLQRQLIAAMLREEKPTEIARRFGVKPPRITELKNQAFARLGHCLWRRVLLEHTPKLTAVVEALDPSVGLHYARGLADRVYGKRCGAGVRRALDTPREALPQLIKALAVNRHANDLGDRLIADVGVRLSETQQRVLVLALWSTETVVLDPKSKRAVLKAPAGGHGYLALDELPPV